MNTLKILAVDDKNEDLILISKSVNIIKQWVNEFLEITITTKNFEDAKSVDVNNYDILFVDMQNSNDPNFYGDDLLQHWNTNNVRGGNFLNKVCLFTNYTNRRLEKMTLKPELFKIKLNAPKNCSTTNIAEIIQLHFMNSCWYNKNKIEFKLAELMTSLSSKKIEIDSNDNFKQLPNKNLIYITNKTNIPYTVRHYFIIENMAIPKTETTRDFYKSFHSKESEEYYAELFHQAKKNNKDVSKRTKPDYKATLKNIIKDYDTNPKLYFRFNRFIINFRFVTLDGFTLTNNNNVGVALQLPRGKTLQVAIENADLEIVQLLNQLVSKSHDTFT